MKVVFKEKEFLNIESFDFVKSQIEECDLVYPVHKSKIFKFCKAFGISDISKASYKERTQYEEYLNSFGVKRPNSYLLAFDRVVIWHRKKKSLDVAKAPALRYIEDDIVYLVYEVRKDKIDVLYDMRGGNYFVWDFSKKYPKKYKKQIADVVASIIESIEEKCDLRQKRRLLISLNFLYDFLPKQGIYDLMRIDRACEKRFEMYLTESYRCLRVCAKVIINLCRKVSFLESAEINWYANVWYMDRFTFDEARVNESDKIETLSFLDIENTENKKTVQNYVKYLVGLTDMSLSTIRSIKYRLEEFVISIGRKSLYDVSAYDIDEYIKEREEKGNKKQFIDRKLVIINNFYKYLLSYERIDRIPFQIDYYISTKFQTTHNDRAVEEKFIYLILENLKFCDSKLRLMFLVQLCTGRRISEVCQIKASSVRKDSGDYWICFYQPKMHEDIMVPIPAKLYDLLKKYIKENKMGNADYVFQAENGSAYNSGLYQRKMAEFVELIGICEDEYDFKSHDFRHTIATHLYDNGVSIQVIRDFLGHKTDEMTKQYIDFIPREIEKKSRVLFEEKAFESGESLNG